MSAVVVVSGVAAGSVVAQTTGLQGPSGATTGIAMTQGGTLVAPTPATPISIQPRDPAKAPFQAYLAGGLFNGQWDDTLAFGYNCDLLTATEPAIYWRLEQDYEVTPGVHWFEYYIEYFSTTRATTFRPIYLNVNRSTNNGQLLLSVPGASGNIAFTDTTGGTTYMQFLPAAGGPVLGNGIALYGYDAGAVNRNLAQVTVGSYAIIGDFALPNSLIVRGGAGGGGLGGLIFEVGPTDKLDFYDSTNALRVRLDTTTGNTPKLQVDATVGALVVSQLGAPTTPAVFSAQLPTDLGFLSFVAANGANALTATQSKANCVILAAGPTGAFTVTFQRAVANTSLLFVRNNSAQIATISYLTGGTVTVAAGTSALVVSDGANLQKLMAGT